MAKKNQSKKKKEVKEIFEVDKKGTEEIVEAKGIEEVPVEKKGQRKQNARTLKIFLIVTVGLIVLLIAGYFYMSSLRYSSYDGVPFVAIQEGDMTFYKTSILDSEMPTNFYFRTKPSKLKRIPFDREGFKLMRFASYNGTDLFDCFEGDEIIAEVTLEKVHEVLGIPLEKVTSGCDPEARLNYYNFIPSDKTEVVRVEENCYDIHVADCQIMAAAEKIIAENFLAYKEMRATQ